MKKGSAPLKEEWEAWEKQGPMTPERGKAFYKQTTNYIYELGEWHCFVDQQAPQRPRSSWRTSWR